MFETRLCNLISRREAAPGVRLADQKMKLINDDSDEEKGGEFASQVGVFAALVRRNRVALCAGKLYLPREWTNDPRRMRAAGVPETEQRYRSKPELAAELIEQLPEAVSFDWIGGDTVHGNSLHLRERLRAAGKAFVLDVGEQLKVYLNDPEPFVMVQKNKRESGGRNFVL